MKKPFPHICLFKAQPQEPIQEDTTRETFELYQLEGLYRGMSYPEWVDERELEFAQALQEFTENTPDFQIDTVVLQDESHVHQVEVSPSFLGWV